MQKTNFISKLLEYVCLKYFGKKESKKAVISIK